MSFDDDLDLILEDSGDTLTAGEITVPCQFMDSDQVVGQSEDAPGQILNVTYVLVRASALPNLCTNAPVSVTSGDSGVTTPYAAAQLHLIQDGKTLQIILGAPGGDF